VRKAVVTNPIAQTVDYKKTIIVLLPLGIPGMGKTTFINSHLKSVLGKLKTRFTMETISSDEIKKSLIDDYLHSHP